MTSRRRIVLILSCVWAIASCTAQPDSHTDTQLTRLEENDSSLSVVSDHEAAPVALTLEKPSPTGDRNAFEPNLLITEILDFAECEQDIELMAGVAAEVILYGSREQGLALFDRTKEFESDHLPYVQQKIGVGLARAGEINQALSISRALINQGLGTDSLPTLLEVAYQVNKRGQTDWADRLLEQAQEVADDSPDYVLGHSVSHDELQNVLTDIAKAYVRIGRTGQALELTKSIRNGGDIHGYVTVENRSQVYSQLLPLLNDVQLVRAVYEHEKTRIRLNRGNGFNALSDIAIRLFQLGDEVLPFQVLEMLESEEETSNVTLLFKNGSARNRILSEMSIHLTNVGRRSEAIEIANQITDEPDGPDNSFMASEFHQYKAFALIHLANAFHQAKKPKKARQFFKEAFLLMQKPGTFAVQDEVAAAFAKTGQIQTAMRYLKASKPIKIDASPEVARHELISSLIKLNHFDEAAELVDWIETKNSTYPIAHCRINRASKQRSELLLTILVHMPDDLKIEIDISEWLSATAIRSKK